MDTSLLLWVLAVLLVLAGLAGLFLPMLPGAVAAWVMDIFGVSVPDYLFVPLTSKKTAANTRRRKSRMSRNPAASEPAW